MFLGDLFGEREIKYAASKCVSFMSSRAAVRKNRCAYLGEEICFFPLPNSGVQEHVSYLAEATETEGKGQSAL